MAKRQSGKLSFGHPVFYVTFIEPIQPQGIYVLMEGQIRTARQTGLVGEREAVPGNVCFRIDTHERSSR